MSKKSDFEKFKRVVKSCNSLDQMPMVYGYGRVLYTKYGENPFLEFFSIFAWELSDIFLNKIIKVIDDRKEKLEFMTNNIDS